MRSWKNLVVVASIIGLSVHISPALAQHADAGISSIESALHDRKHETINLDYMYANSGSDTVLTHTTYQLSGDISLFTGTKLWASLPLVMTEGPLGGVSGIGDLILVINQKLFTIAGAGAYIDFGTRLATGTQNADSLPQQYQTGLGSNDLMLGVSVVSDNINFGIGYQLNGGRAANAITRLERGDDFIVRGGYMHRGEEFDFGGELMAIKKLEEQSILDHIDSLDREIFTNLPGSDDLQINGLLKARWNLADAFALTGTIGFPILDRKNNYDGLSRAYTVTAGVAIKF